jgi:hypothetical protein
MVRVGLITSIRDIEEPYPIDHGRGLRAGGYWRREEAEGEHR